MLEFLENTDQCWVPPKCSVLEQFHFRVVLPLLNTTRVFYNTIIKHVIKDKRGRCIIQINAIQRIPHQLFIDNCQFLSEELPDWYSEKDSAWYYKSQLIFINISFVIEGTS
ncbi:unnamed protein product [Rotaria sp. Silwood2]|nr:unnamed protein product [Rotaria sp. Silwood2]